jgi:hypothetical protein
MNLGLRARRRFAAAVTCLAMLGVAVAACTSGTDPVAASRKAFEKRAVQVARAWEASATAGLWQHSLVMLSTVTWRPDLWPGPSLVTKIGEPTFSAVSASWYVLDLPPGQQPTPRSGTVTFSDGSTLAVPLESPTKAFQEFVAPGPCHPAATPPAAPTPPSGATADCPRARITGVALGIRHVMTGRGEADVPMWLYTIPGVDIPLERVAIDPSAYSLPRGTGGGTENTGVDYVAPGFYGSASLQAVDGTAVTYRVWAGACDKVLGPLVYEDAKAVVVGATVIEYTGSCQASLNLHRMSVTLRAPLGDRIVLDGVTGNPLPLWQADF